MLQLYDMLCYMRHKKKKVFCCFGLISGIHYLFTKSEENMLAVFDYFLKLYLHAHYFVSLHT